jgi:hypothetical protein
VGSDDLHHKRKARSAKQLARKKESRESYERALIVCEGSKTEPNYFCELVSSLELNTANVEVDGNCGSSPISVFNYAKKRYLEEKRTGDGFDRVFCVFDKDSHDSYEEALRLIGEMKPNSVFKAIVSVPCFEYWLLLHYVFTTKPFEADGNGSKCASLISELKKYHHNYAKGDENIYGELSGQMGQAIAYSKRALAQAKENDTDNPSTCIHELVEYLQALKS